MRDATESLLAAGLVNPGQLIRLGAAEMVARSLAAWRSSGSGDVRVLAQMIRQGGPSARDRGPVSERQRIVAEMNAWQRGYEDGAS